MMNVKQSKCMADMGVERCRSHALYWVGWNGEENVSVSAVETYIVLQRRIERKDLECHNLGDGGICDSWLSDFFFSYFVCQPTILQNLRWV